MRQSVPTPTIITIYLHVSSIMIPTISTPDTCGYLVVRISVHLITSTIGTISSELLMILVVRIITYRLWIPADRFLGVVVVVMIVSVVLPN